MKTKTTLIFLRLQLIVAAFLAPFLTLSAAFDLYWTESDRIMGSDIDGENVTVVFDGSEAMAGIAVDILVTGDHIYWTDHPNSTAAAIWRGGRDGSNPEKIVEFGNFRAPHFFALDEPNGHIYFTDFGRGIFRIDLDGSNEEWVFNGQAAFPAAANHTGIYLRGPGDPVFLSTAFTVYEPGGDEFATWATAIATLPGSGATYGVAFDEATQTVYYTTYNGGQLRSYNLNTQEGHVLRSGLREPLGVKLSPSKTHLLIAERGRGISAFQIDNFGYELLVFSTGAHFGVAVTADPADLPPGEDPSDLPWLFRANFENDIAGEPPVSDWSAFGTPAAGSAVVVEDTENFFGGGTDNQYLRVESVSNLNFQANFEPVDVLTLSFDFIGRVYQDDGNRHINVNLRAGPTNDDRVHLTQLRMWNATVPPANLSYGGNNFPIRLDTIVNNSTESITYDRPDGEGTADLAAGMASLWIYHYIWGTWEQLYDEYQNVRHDSVQLGDGIINLWFQADSNVTRRSYDLDDVYVFEGAVPGKLLREADIDLPDVSYPEEPVLVVHDDFNHTEVTPAEVDRIAPEDYNGPLVLAYHGSASGQLRIVEDVDNLFGRGTDNRVLYMEELNGLRMNAYTQIDSGVVTYAFDMHHLGEFSDQGTDTLTSRFWTGGPGATTVINFSLAEADAATGSYAVSGINRQIAPGFTQRYALIVNNTWEEITYQSPNGPRTLGAGQSVVWLNGYPFAVPYSFGSEVMIPAAIDSFQLSTASSGYWTGYIDNIRIWEGALVPGAEVPGRDVDPEPRDLLVYEGFDYTEGSLLGNDGGTGWAEGYAQFGDFDSAQVTSPGLEFGVLPVAGNKIHSSGASRNFRVIDTDGIHSDWLNPYADHVGRKGTSIWVSALIQAVEPVGNPFMGFGFYRDTHEQSGETVFFGKATGDQTAPDRGWRLQGAQGSATGAGLGTAGESGSATLYTGVSYGELSFVVLRIDYREGGNDRIYLFHNPDPDGPMPPDEDAIGFIETPVGSYGFDRIRIAGNDNGFHFDELRVGTTWQAVTGQDAVDPGEGYTAWAESHFPGETDPAIVGPDANPAGDGVRNLIKYALGLDPTVPSRDGLPAAGFESVGEDDYLTLAFSAPDDVDDVFYTVVAGSELGDLDGLAEHVSSSPDPDRPGHSIHLYRDTEPVAANSRRFMELSVEFQ